MILAGRQRSPVLSAWRFVGFYRLTRLITVVIAMALPSLAHGSDADDAELALQDALFELDMENVSYTVRPDGFIDITFGASVDNDAYIDAVEALRANPKIPGILPGRGSTDFCELP